MFVVFYNYLPEVSDMSPLVRRVALSILAHLFNFHSPDPS